MTTYNPKLILHTEADALHDLTFNKKPDCAEKMTKLFRWAVDTLRYSLDDAHDYAVLKHLDQDHADADDPITTAEQERAELMEAITGSEYADHLEACLQRFDKFLSWGVSPHLAMSAAVKPLQLQIDDQNEKLALAGIDREFAEPVRSQMRQTFLQLRANGVNVEEAITLAGLMVAVGGGLTEDFPPPPPGYKEYLN